MERRLRLSLVASTVGSARSTLSAPTRVSASQMVCFAARVMIATSDCSAMKRWEPVSNASRMKLAHPARSVLVASARPSIDEPSNGEIGSPDGDDSSGFGCSSDSDCSYGVCDFESGYCVDCRADLDCPADYLCDGGYCVEGESAGPDLGGGGGLPDFPDRATTSRRASPKLIVMLRAPFVIQTAACVSHAATR